jgi:tRNA A37 threonylcarbamoyladenosine synthetase subunit TsaC/SUA5/YrdC
VGSVTDTVGVRVPALGVTRRLLARSGPLAVTSANRHGETPCDDADEVRAVFSDSPELVGVLDGGSGGSTASTVATIDGGAVRILRHGAVLEAELRACLGETPLG